MSIDRDFWAENTAIHKAGNGMTHSGTAGTCISQHCMPDSMLARYVGADALREAAQRLMKQRRPVGRGMIERRVVCGTCGQQQGLFHKGCPGRWVAQCRSVTEWVTDIEALPDEPNESLRRLAQRHLPGS